LRKRLTAALDRFKQEFAASGAEGAPKAAA